MNTSIGPIGDEGPKFGRNMGFPDMKYMDTDAQGPPVIEKTLYKEYQENRNNDVKLQREALSKPQ